MIYHYPMENQKTVLVTGGSGFIATHCIIQLVAAGYQIKSTVRDLSRVENLNQIISNGLKEQNIVNELAIDWNQATLTDDEGWDVAVAGSDYVLHVASPVAMEMPKDENEMITPAVEGTKRVLQAASKAGVKRVVVTSSVAAILYGTEKQEPFTEADWTDVNSKSANAYAKSKTYAEKAAWEFIDKDTSGMELACVNPSLVLGPILEKDYGTSVGVVVEFLSGKYPFVPNMDFGVVDVRDVAALEILAMTHPEAAGKRFICSESTMKLKDQSDLLIELLPEFKKKLPKGIAPNWLIKIMALFMPPLKSVTSEIGKNRELDSSRARNLLGWHPRPAAEALRAAAESVVKFGLVNPD